MAVLLRQRALLVPPPPIALVLPGARATVQVCLSELSVYQREAIEIWATATECLRWRRRAEEVGDDDGDDDEVTRRDPPPLGGPLSKAKRVQARAVFWMPQCLSPSSLSLSLSLSCSFQRCPPSTHSAAHPLTYASGRLCLLSNPIHPWVALVCRERASLPFALPVSLSVVPNESVVFIGKHADKAVYSRSTSAS